MQANWCFMTSKTCVRCSCVFRNSFSVISDGNGREKWSFPWPESTQIRGIWKFPVNFQYFLMVRTIWRLKICQITSKTRGIDQARSLDIVRYQEFCPTRSELGDIEVGKKLFFPQFVSSWRESFKGPFSGTHQENLDDWFCNSRISENEMHFQEIIVGKFSKT